MTVLLNTLYVTTPDAYLRLEGETVCVMVEDQKRLQVPLHHLGGFVLFGHAMMSPGLLGRCAEDGRSVVWLSREGRFRARLEGPVNGNILLRQAQHRAADDPARTLALARATVAGKLRNSRQVLVRGARETESAEERESLVRTARVVGNQLRKLPEAASVDQVRGYEGDVARAYFEAVPWLMKGPARAAFPLGVE